METFREKVKDILISQLNKAVVISPSPLMLWMKPVVKEVGEGTLTFDYTVTHLMTNAADTLHGGMIAAMMDDMIGATIICLGRSTLYTTVNNVIDYFAPAKFGDVVTGKTTIIKAGRQVINVQFELWNMAKQRLLARGYSNCLRTDVMMSETGNAAQSSHPE